MRWMRRAKQMRVHRRLGYGSFHEYIEHLFGYSPRLAYERLRVDEILQQLARRELEDEAGEGKCDEGSQVAGGEAEPVDDATVARVTCDAKASGGRVDRDGRGRHPVAC